ncbi:hypothetical protein BRC92_11540 [Halobacteriales archaeon QS_4_69_31]|jgi:hypothetical protein|nr:MAG: hypothetical protein BRC92_11540 [Halobacteriales archaeon QS_4_69_31]
MAEDTETEVPVVCPACETTTRVALSDLAETVDGHNDRLHDGEEVATVDPEVADHLLDMVADDLLAAE